MRNSRVAKDVNEIGMQLYIYVDLRLHMFNLFLIYGSISISKKKKIENKIA